MYYQLSKLRKRDYSKIIKEKLDDGYNFIISKNLSLGTYLFVKEWKTPKEELSFIMKEIDDLMREYRNNNIIVDNLTLEKIYNNLDFLNFIHALKIKNIQHF